MARLCIVKMTCFYKSKGPKRERTGRGLWFRDSTGILANTILEHLKYMFFCTSLQKKAIAGSSSLSSVKERILILTSNIKKLRLKKAQQTAKLAMIQAQEAKNDAEMLRLSSLDTSTNNI